MHDDAWEAQVRSEAKRVLRSKFQALRAKLPKVACLERSKHIVRHLVALPSFGEAGVVGIFLPIGNEVDVRAIADEARALGKQIAVPYLGRDPNQSAMRFVVLDADSPLETHGRGFMQPSTPESALVVVEPDWVLTPCLVVDLAGYRIGYGAGFYDRYFERHQVIKVAVAYDFQLVGEVPHCEGDVPVDWIVTDKAVHAALRGAK